MGGANFEDPRAVGEVMVQVVMGVEALMEAGCGYDGQGEVEVASG